MRILLAVLFVISSFHGAVAATGPLGDTDGDAPSSITGRVLLDQLSSNQESDHSCALGYIMGVLGVHSGETVLPSMKKQEKIGKIVKDALEIREADLDRSAGELLKEIYDADTGRLHKLMGSGALPPSQRPE